MSKIYTHYEKNDGQTTDVVLRRYLDRREVADPIISRETTVAIIEDLTDASLDIPLVDLPEDNEVYLAHYGVKGQKWGVRRTAAQLGRKKNREMHRKKQHAQIKSAVKTAGKFAVGQTEGQKMLRRGDKEGFKAKGKEERRRLGSAAKTAGKFVLGTTQDQKDLRAHDKAVRDATIKDAKEGVSKLKSKIGNKFRKGVANRQEKMAKESQKISDEHNAEAAKSKKRMGVLKKEVMTHANEANKQLKIHNDIIKKNNGIDTDAATPSYKAFKKADKMARKSAKAYKKESENHAFMDEIGKAMAQEAKHLTALAAENRKRKSGLA